MAIKKPNLALNGERLGELLIDSDFTEEHPTLVEYLTLEKYEDDTPRLTSTLLIFMDKGVLKLCLSDRETNRTAFVTSPTVEGAFRILEEGLRDDTLDWRVKRDFKQSGAKPPF